MTMEIDALHSGQPMRNSLDPCNTCAEWQQQAERVRVLEADGPQMRRGSHGDGSDWMGSMRECLNDAMQAASVEANLGDEARAEVKRLTERVRVLREALDGLLLSHPHANDGMHGYCVLVTTDQVLACRSARAALEATK